MPYFHLKPITAGLDDQAWEASWYRQDAWVNAADEREARALASGRFEDARTASPKERVGANPWLDPRLVSAQTIAAMPAGMDLPPGSVMAERQL